MILKTAEQITSKFIKDGWSNNISFSELELKEAIEKGLLFAVRGIEQGKKYFSVASGGGTGRTLHPDNMAAGPASYGMTDTMGRMHSDAQFAGSSSVPAHVEMMGLIGMGNNPMVGATVAVAVAVEECLK
jgi:hypothetical protein